jgi:hypothetical protein
MNFNRGEYEINQKDSMLSDLLNNAKLRAQLVMKDPPHVDPQHVQEGQLEQKHILDQEWPHHTILLMVGKGNYNIDSF